MQNGDLDAAYRAAVYRVFAPAGPIDLRIGEPAPALGALAAGRPWAIVTAFNPGSVPRDHAANEAAHAELAAALAGHQTLASEGRSADGTWREPGLLVIGIDPDAAVAIGRRFGQAGIVVGKGGEPPRLVSCG